MIRRSLSSPLLLATLAVLAGGCASGGAATRSIDAPSAVAERGARSSTYLITEEQVAGVQVSTALEVVQRLRPGWLRGRGVDGITRSTTVQVYVDGVRYGGPGSLASVSTSGIQSIRYYDANEATQRWGTGHARGAIEVRTH